jgi:hypothetical protein
MVRQFFYSRTQRGGTIITNAVVGKADRREMLNRGSESGRRMGSAISTKWFFDRPQAASLHVAKSSSLKNRFAQRHCALVPNFVAGESRKGVRGGVVKPLRWMYI